MSLAFRPSLGFLFLAYLFSHTFAALKNRRALFKLFTAIKKDLRILLRDKAALAVIFVMPVLLVVVITSIQNSAYKLVNDHSIPLLICNRDTGASSKQLVVALDKIGMFDLTKADAALDDRQVSDLMHQKEALVSIVIPEGFSIAMSAKAKSIAGKALTEFGLASEDAKPKDSVLPAPLPLTLFYNPVLQESFRFSVGGALRSAQQFTENQEILQALYLSLNNKQLPASLEEEIFGNRTVINEIPVAKDGSSIIPNATQHNVPAWTIFAMFFIVVSLSTSIVKEKLSGSAVRLKTLPTSFLMNLGAKQITYVVVTLAQVAVIFSLGIFLFPHIGLPKLVLPTNLFNLLIVSMVCGWCAVSYGVLVGVYAKSMEQAIGFGAVSVVILAAIGGIVVPAFAMPEPLRIAMKFSPMHWCMEAFYTLFLKAGYTKDVIASLIPLLVIIFALQLAAVAGLRKQNFI